MVELLSDPTRCQVMLVTLPEETPVNELVDTAFAIEDRAGVALGPVVVNGVLDDLAGIAGARCDAVERRAPKPSAPARPLARRAGRRARAAAELPRATGRPSAGAGARLAERLPLPQIRLPFLFTADIGPSEIDALADAFAASVAAHRAPETRS